MCEPNVPIIDKTKETTMCEPNVPLIDKSEETILRESNVPITDKSKETLLCEPYVSITDKSKETLLCEPYVSVTDKSEETILRESNVSMSGNSRETILCEPNVSITGNSRETIPCVSSVSITGNSRETIPCESNETIIEKTRKWNVCEPNDWTPGERREIILCDPCSFDHDEVQALAFCTDCTEYLCKSCHKDHKKNKMTRNHRVLVVDEVPSSKETFEMLKDLVCCKIHPSKEIAYKCLNHNEYICIECESKRHRQCENMEDIQKLSKNDTRDVDLLMKTVEENIDLITKHYQDRADNISTLETDLCNVKDEINETINQITDILIDMKSQLNVSAEKIVKEQVVACNVAIDKEKMLITNYERQKQTVVMAIKYGSPTHVHIASERIREHMLSSGKQLNLLKVCDRLKLKFSSNVKKFSSLQLGSLELSNLTSTVTSTLSDTDLGRDAVSEEQGETMSSTDVNIGEKMVQDQLVTGATSLVPQMIHDKLVAGASLVSPMFQYKLVTGATSLVPPMVQDKLVTGATSLVPPMVQEKLVTGATSLVSSMVQDKLVTGATALVPPMVLGKPLMNCSLEQEGIYRIDQATNEYIPNIYGIVCLGDRIVLIDRNNSLLIMLDQSYRIQAQKQLESNPLGLCAMDDDTVVLTLRSRRVQRYRVANHSFELINQFDVKLNCRGIAKAGEHVAILMSDEDVDEEISIDCNDSSEVDDVIEVQIRRVHNGHKVKVVDNFFGKSGHYVNLNNPMFLLYTEDDHIILGEYNKLSDFDDDERRQQIFRRMDHHINGIGGLASDNEDNIYVCGKDSNNVHQISSEDFRANRVVISQIHEPWAIAFDSVRKRLIVSCEDSDMLHVFQFCD